jgi:hypothetical protein
MKTLVRQLRHSNAERWKDEKFWGLTMKWIMDNYLVLISGIAVPAIYGLGKLFLKKDDKTQIKQKQKSGKNSTNIQVGGNVEINKKDV